MSKDEKLESTDSRIIESNKGIGIKPEIKPAANDLVVNNSKKQKNVIINKKGAELSEANDQGEKTVHQFEKFSESYATKNSVVVAGICAGSTTLAGAYVVAAVLGVTTFVFPLFSIPLVASVVSGTILLLRGSKSIEKDRIYGDEQRALDHLKSQFDKLSPSMKANMEEDYERECRLIVFGRTIDH